jgi:hypothetical protein
MAAAPGRSPNSRITLISAASFAVWPETWFGARSWRVEMKKTYSKPVLIKKGKLSQITANGNGSVVL